MRKVKVNLAELTDALDNGFEDLTYYLDTETGETVLVTSEGNQHLEAIYEAMDGGEDEPRFNFEEALQQRNIPGWQQEMVRTADKIEEGFGTRFFRVPRSESHDGYRDMEDFIDGLPNARVQERLSDAIRGRGPFRRFKDVLLDYPTERNTGLPSRQPASGNVLSRGSRTKASSRLRTRHSLSRRTARAAYQRLRDRCGGRRVCPPRRRPAW